MTPSTWVYGAAAVGGVASGMAAQVWLGWPWWMVELGVLFAAWLGFMLTASRPLPGEPRRRGRR